MRMVTETTVESSENKKLEDKLRLMTPDDDDKDGECWKLKTKQIIALTK